MLAINVVPAGRSYPLQLKSSDKMRDAIKMLHDDIKHGKALHTLTLNIPGFENFMERSDRMRALIANGLVVLG